MAEKSVLDVLTKNEVRHADGNMVEIMQAMQGYQGKIFHATKEYSLWWRSTHL